MRGIGGSHARHHSRHALHHFALDDLDHNAMVAHGTPTIDRRTPSSSGSSSSSTCGPGNNSAICEKPIGGSTETLPIILGAVIPICCAFLVFIYLHRRHVKKQRIEDESYAHKSLDFGMGSIRRKKGDIPEMTVTDLGPSVIPGVGRRGKGVSLDVMSPYLLPGGLQDSRESLHSLSRSLHDEHDPYRPVTALRETSDPLKHRFADNGSLYSNSTGQISASEKAHLVVNAQRMSQSPVKPLPPIDSKMTSPHGSQAPSNEFIFHDETSHHEDELELSPPHSPPHSPPSIHIAESSPPPPPRISSVYSAPRPPRKDSIHYGQFDPRESSNSGDFGQPLPPTAAMPPIPIVNEPEPEVEPQHNAGFPMVHPEQFSAEHLAETQQPLANHRLSIMGLRPLPPDTILAEDNPEQRANRIRSFYKEYFDDSKPDPDGVLDYYEEVYDGAIYDETSGQFVMASKPFAQAPGRRAMTPPPRGASNMQHFSSNNPHRRQFSSMSHARGRPPVQKQQLPPPKPLQSLPTPYKLDIESAIAHAIDFAPKSSFRDFQNGRRPDSPAGSSRPYSPAFRPFTPLASSYDDLAVMPSPYMLRKSGTFTALDFAPPRLRIQETSSDAGSIRSARSGISAMQMDAVRSGAYRVSRIPKEMVTTREDMSSQLRPKLNMVTPA